MTTRMPNSFSLYLDVLRVIAALTVLLSHYPVSAAQAAITDQINFGYDAVIVFFVLSGYVISHAVNTKETSPLIYSVNRIARILPVAAVAIALSYLLMVLMGPSNPHYYPDASQLHNALYIAARTLFFTNEFWWTDIRPFGNGPYWSLAFEVWCYVLFGIAIFTRGRWRICCLALVLLITGPKQWLMLPIWLAGVVAFNCRDKFVFSRGTLWALSLLPVVVFLGVQASNPRDWSYPLVGMHVEAMLGHGLDGAANFGWGYLLAALVAIHLFAVRRLCNADAAPIKHGASVIRYLAAYTFSLYIYHYPLLMFWQATLVAERDIYEPGLRAVIYAGVLVPVFVLGYLVERRKVQVRTAIYAVLAAATRWSGFKGK